MRMRPLIIDDEARASIARVLAYAKDHHYKQGDMPPGLNQNHVVVLNTYRVVFSFTKAADQLFRHMTISVPGESYPHPVSAYALAALFGFTGWDISTNPNDPPLDWGIKVDKKDHCIVIAQIIEKGNA